MEITMKHKKLNKNGIETRPIVAGNFLRNPVIKHINFIKCDCTNANILHDQGFFIGNNILDLQDNLQEVKKLIEETF
jgi:CDP-6-deoxy-D-xylo-4-hexulose-3-dehydrase